MARLAGVDLPREKRVEIGLTYIYGIGLSRSQEILKNAGELVEAFKRTPLNGGSRLDSGRILDCHKNHNGHKDVYGRINSFLPAPTMTASCTNPSKGRFVHPTEHHGITVRQAARIQTFPDDFIFYGGLTSATRQIGNAVPVRMAEVVLKPIYDILISTNKSESVSQAA